MMRFNTIILACYIVLLLNFGSQAMAAEKIFVNYSPFTAINQDPNKGTTVNWQQIADQLNILSPYAQWVRTYSCVNGMENVGPIAHNLGLGVAAGAWFSQDKAQNIIELDALIAVCQKGHADVAILGSETLHRGDLTGSELIGYITRFRQALPGFPVIISDIYSTLANNPDVVNASDAIMINIYPYWEGIEIMEAVPHLHKIYLDFKRQFPDKLIVIGETGWPSAGDTIGAAVPDPLYAAFYFCSVVSWAKAENVYVFYFEAFDEPWKTLYEGPQGANWGLWDQYGNLKPYMEYGLSGYNIADYWSCKPVLAGNGQPSIELTFIPALGSTDNLQGKLLNISPEDYNVVVYIYVSGNWWIKPYFNSSITKVACNGTWTCDITTGDNDAMATKIAVFAIPWYYSPPVLGGCGSLPDELYQNAIANVVINR